MKYIANIWVVMLILFFGALAAPLDLQAHHSASSDTITFSENKQAFVFSEANPLNIIDQIPLFVFDDDEEDDDDTQHYTAIATLHTQNFTYIAQGNVLLQQNSFLYHIVAYNTQKLFLLYKSLKIAC